MVGWGASKTRLEYTHGLGQSDSLRGDGGGLAFTALLVPAYLPSFTHQVNQWSKHSERIKWGMDCHMQDVNEAGGKKEKQRHRVHVLISVQ